MHLLQGQDNKGYKKFEKTLTEEEKKETERKAKEAKKEAEKKAEEERL